MKNKKGNLFLAILFMYIYNPPIIKGLNLFFLVCSIGYIIMSCINKEVKFKKKIMKDIFIIILIMLYSLVIETSANASYTVYKENISSFIIKPLIAVAIVIFIKKKKNADMDIMINFLIKIATFQGVISLLMFFIPEFKDFILKRVYMDGMSLDRVELYERMSKWRINGISAGITGGMPVFQAIMAGFSWKYFFCGEKIKIINMLIIIASFLLNGRTGIVVFIGIIAYFYINKINIRKILLFTCTSLLISIFFNNIIEFMQGLKSKNLTISWILEGINDILNLLKGKNTGVMSDLNSEAFNQIPKGLDLVFGTGNRIFGGNIIDGVYRNSDKGYINDLWFGGIIYSTMIYIYIIISVCENYYTREKIKYIKYKDLAIIVAMVIVIWHIKSFFYQASPVWNFLLLIIFFNKIKRIE